MIVDRENKTCTLTEEDREIMNKDTDDVFRSVLDSMIEDIRQDLERWTREYVIEDTEKIGAKEGDEFFEMAWEMFECCYSGALRDTVVDIVSRTVIV